MKKSSQKRIIKENMNKKIEKKGYTWKWEEKQNQKE